MTAVYADAQKCSEQFLIPEGRKILSENGLKITPFFSSLQFRHYRGPRTVCKLWVVQFNSERQ
jgi:hypothetical protein